MSHSKDIVIYLANSFEPANLNYPVQVKLAKKLLDEYTYEEIIYAIDYYKKQGINMYSLGFLTYKNNMNHPMSLYSAEKNKQNPDESGERNRKRIERILQTEYRKDYPCSLFAE